MHMAHTKACNGMGKMCVLIRGGRRKHGDRCRVMWIRLKGDYLGQVAKKMEMERNAGVMLLDRFKGG